MVGDDDCTATLQADEQGVITILQDPRRMVIEPPAGVTTEIRID